MEISNLFDAEETWAPARVRMLRELTHRYVPQTSWPESLHWNWAKKAAGMSPARLGALGDIRIFGIHADSAWQGILLAKAAGYYTRLAPNGRELIYVEYLESAPWNWEQPLINQVARYRGVGTKLVGLSVLWSLQLGFQGRVGLHALPQAEDFYRRRCGMTDLGADKNQERYRGMRYFEFSVKQANQFLKGGMP
ncbi:MAG: GNAT family N-acetyltransferase [Phycisphaerales bacterium]|nr:GNAT family N-acetyltransferase [Phycisphaerales bacterium]